MRKWIRKIWRRELRRMPVAWFEVSIFTLADFSLAKAFFSHTLKFCFGKWRAISEL